jgi:DNA invertase Pin-like site-specific DNA recombinase
MKAAIYSRVSTPGQAADDKVSLEDQEERCRAMCATKGWEVAEVYDEGDASAGSAQRDEFQRMIADAKAGKFDVVVCREVSRLSRVAQARRAIEELMIEWGIGVCNARTGMVYSETDGLGASVIWTIEAKMAEAELAEKSFRTTMGKNGKAARGLYPSGAVPYGYRWTGGENSAVAIHEERAELVRWMFGQVLAGHNCSEIARELNRRGIPTPRHSEGGWGRSFVHSVIKNRVYLGEYEYGSTHWRKLNSEKDRREWARQYFERTGMPPKTIPRKVLEPGMGDRHQVEFPVIIDRDIWDRANSRLERTFKTRETPKRIALLLGILRCEECGRHMKSMWARNHAGEPFWYYRCQMAVKDADRFACRVTDRSRGVSAYVSASRIEGEVWRLVDQMMSDPERLAAAVGAHLGRDSESVDAQQGRIDRHELRLRQTEAAWTKARRAYYDGNVSEADFERDREHFEREIAILDDELRRMRSAVDDRRRQGAALLELETLARMWTQTRETFTEAERRAIVEQFVQDVTISKDNQFTITGTIGGLMAAPVGVMASPADWFEKREVWLPGLVAQSVLRDVSQIQLPSVMKLRRRETSVRRQGAAIAFWSTALDSGKVSSRADLAKRLGLSRARVTQALNHRSKHDRETADC